MAENSDKREIKLKITKEQFWAIYHFFNFNDWDLQEAAVYSEWGFDEDQNIRPAAGTVTTDNSGDGNDDDQNALKNHQQDNFHGNGRDDRDGYNNNNNNDNHDNSQQQQEQICQHCFLSPCITMYRQSWLGYGAAPHERNVPLRKKKYKLFWKVISEHGGWLQPKYVEKKQQLLHRTMDDSIVWTTREVMPGCVLNLVRGLYPNLSGQLYMGHKWL